MPLLTDLVREFGGDLSPERSAVDVACVEVRDVQLDSRLVGAGDLFAALPGRAADGARFVDDALARGATAILSPARLPASRLPTWVHADARRVAGEVAALAHGRPSNSMFVVAITGTNGKTTTAHLTGQLLRHVGRRPATLGTAGNRLADGVLLAASHTTPDAPGLQRLLARHRELGGDSVALEASSHALEQDRLAGLHVSVAVFTNLTRDHLDYHGDMASYAAAKERLFSALDASGHAVVNADDPAGEQMARAALARGATVHKIGTRSRADLRASRLEVDSRGTSFFVQGMGIPRTSVSFPLVGRFNVENALAALAAVLLSGASPSDALEGLATVSAAPGRLERVPTGELGFTVLVDYAHSDDALRKVLEVVRERLLTEARRHGDHGGRLICVFGCGGDRDPGKRGAMGKTAGSLADLVLVTSDNPRTEDPLAIIAAIEGGLAGSAAQVHVEPDRRRAIENAIGAARRRDVVLICGKGHETTQTIGTAVFPFDDRAVAAEILSAAGSGR
jgi:UDP-N-acetylmuramoyl-L-alanyl-D-glutamate--2,6-diaminopimelate ligase